MMPPSGRRTRERGVVLVLFAMIAFALMGVAALCVDMGIVILTRVEMQTAVDTAALEGLRFRDAAPGATRPELEEIRREQASLFARLTFDENLQLPEIDLTDDTRNLGAGPVFDLSGGMTEANASQLIGRNSYVYQPLLQLNLGNEVFGDMVSGTYVEDRFFEAVEDSVYRRSDFVPANPNPQGGLGNTPDDSFLVRMRRTNNFQGLDAIPGVSSSGPALPFLFGRGTVMSVNQAGPFGGYNPRVHGLTVRATAIADARPALAVGTSLALGGLAQERRALGVLPFVIWNQIWKKFDQIQSEDIPLIANERGKIKVYDGGSPAPRPNPLETGGGGSLVDNRPEFLNVYVDQLDRRVFAFFPPEPLPLSVGTRVIRLSRDFRWDRPFNLVGFAPVVKVFNREEGFPEDEPLGPHPGYVRVIGFVLVQIKGQQIPGPVSIRKFPDVIVPQNASAAIPEGLAALKKRQVTAIMASHARLNDPILAPVLVK